MATAFLIFKCGLCGAELKKVTRPNSGEDQELITPFYCGSCKKDTGLRWGPSFLELKNSSARGMVD